MTRPVRPAAWDDVPRRALPALWVLAALWVWLTSAARAFNDLLLVAERWHEVAGRAVTRGVRAVLRALGPLGRAVLRLITPVFVQLHRARGLAFRWLLEHVVVPLARATVLAWEWSRPVRRRVVAALVRLAVRARPLLLVLAYMTSTLRRAGARVAAWCRRAWAPVVCAAHELRRLLPRFEGPQP